MKTAILVITLLLSTLSCYKSLAQRTVNPEEIINRYIGKVGGEGKWDSIHSVKMIIQSKPAHGNSITIISIKQNPFKYYNKTSLNYKGSSSNEKSKEYIEIYNQGTALSIAGSKVDTIKDVKKLDDLKLQTFMLSDIAYKELNYKISLIGTQQIDGTENYLIRIESPNGSILNRFYNKESGLLTMDQMEDGSKYVYTSYEPVHGFLIPKKFTYVTPNGAIEFSVKEILFNEPVDPKIFMF